MLFIVGKYLLLLTMYLRWGRDLNIDSSTLLRLLTRDYIYRGTRCNDAPFGKYEHFRRLPFNKLLTLSIIDTAFV